MSNWKLINKTYLYDGTFEGFLTIVFDSYSTRTLPQKIYEAQSYVPNFLDKKVMIATDENKAQRVFYGIEKNISKDTLKTAYNAFLSGEKEKELDILKYLCDGFDLGPKINHMLTISYVYRVIQMRKRTLFECHRFTGLLRFQEIGENLFYASMHPDNHILESLGQHFIQRLPTQNFIIHDKVRNLCLLYNTKEYKIVDSNQMQVPEISKLEKQYQDLWKLFYETISIKERKNPRCQMQFMPKKYWKDLIETP